MMGGEDKLEQTELYSDHRKRMFFCFVSLLNSTCFSTGASSVQSFVTATTKKDPFTSPVRREREKQNRRPSSHQLERCIYIGCGPSGRERSVSVFPGRVRCVSCLLSQIRLCHHPPPLSSSLHSRLRPYSSSFLL